ncbi:MAG TPA: hypothetical protein VGB98_12825 [Pyrinomonadaceae bacterium]|jgi:hypothetical protein
MDLVVEDSDGENIVAREMGESDWMPEATVDAHEVEVFVQEVDAATGGLVGALRPLGRFAPTARIVFQNTPYEDHNLRVIVRAYAADGTPDSPSLREAATQMTVLVQRETAAPTVTQAGEASQTEITLEVGGYSQFALRRKVRVADNADMTGAAETITAAAGAGLSRVVVVNRADTETEAQTIYVRVSHSSSTDGPFGAESDAQAFTFADDAGAGGSSGGGDPFGREQIPL